MSRTKEIGMNEDYSGPAHTPTMAESLDRASTADDFYDLQMDRMFWAKGPTTPKPDAINPSHYQGYIMQLQWLEAMQYLPNMRDPNNFKAAVELQARKYIDRLGGKDAELQELKKAIWYLKFLAAYIANGNEPIRVADIKTLLGE